MRPTETTDLYARLGVDKTATAEEIKSGYRRSVIQWHPDKCRETDAHDQFLAVQNAFETLSNPIRRRAYDNGHATTSGFTRDFGFRGRKSKTDFSFEEWYQNFREELRRTGFDFDAGGHNTHSHGFEQAESDEKFRKHAEDLRRAQEETDKKYADMLDKLRKMQEEIERKAQERFDDLYSEKNPTPRPFRDLEEYLRNDTKKDIKNYYKDKFDKDL